MECDHGEWWVNVVDGMRWLQNTYTRRYWVGKRQRIGIKFTERYSSGWYFGSQEFREKLLRLSDGDWEAKKAKTADGYGGAQMQAHGDLRARQIVASGLKLFDLEAQEFARLPCNDECKLIIAEAIHSETSMRLDWIRDILKMGARAYCSQLIGHHKRCMENSPELR